MSPKIPSTDIVSDNTSGQFHQLPHALKTFTPDKSYSNLTAVTRRVTSLLLLCTTLLSFMVHECKDCGYLRTLIIGDAHSTPLKDAYLLLHIQVE